MTGSELASSPVSICETPIKGGGARPQLACVTRLATLVLLIRVRSTFIVASSNIVQALPNCRPQVAKTAQLPLGRTKSAQLSIVCGAEQAASVRCATLLAHSLPQRGSIGPSPASSRGHLKAAQRFSAASLRARRRKPRIDFIADASVDRRRFNYISTVLDQG